MEVSKARFAFSGKAAHVLTHFGAEKRVIGVRLGRLVDEFGQLPILLGLPKQRLGRLISLLAHSCGHQQVAGVFGRLTTDNLAHLAMPGLGISRLSLGDIEEVALTPTSHRHIDTGLVQVANPCHHTGDIDGRALGTMPSSGIAQLGVFIEVVAV